MGDPMGVAMIEKGIEYLMRCLARKPRRESEGVSNRVTHERQLRDYLLARKETTAARETVETLQEAGFADIAEEHSARLEALERDLKEQREALSSLRKELKIIKFGG